MRSKPYRCPKPKKKSGCPFLLVLLLGIPTGFVFIGYGLWRWMS